MVQEETTGTRDPTWVVTAVLITLAVCTMIWLIAIVTIPLLPALLLPVVLATSAICAIVSVWLMPGALSFRSALLPVVMGVLAGLAPIAVVLAIRLSVVTCTVVNVFGLPWAEPGRSVIHAATIGIWIASCTLLIFGLVRDNGLRRPAIAMSVWSAIAIVPAFLLLFITFYGDPAAGCVPT